MKIASIIWFFRYIFLDLECGTMGHVFLLLTFCQFVGYNTYKVFDLRSASRTESVCFFSFKTAILAFFFHIQIVQLFESLKHKIKIKKKMVSER